MQGGILGWILEQKEDISGNLGKVWSLVNSKEPMLISQF